MSLILSSLRQFVKPSLYQVIFHATFACNSKCITCFNHDELNKRVHEELTLKEVENIATHMPKFTWLMLSGGEPVLRQDLAEVIAIFYKKNGVRHINLPTSGINTEQIINVVSKVLKSCPKASFTLALSLDHLGVRHDKIRGVPGNFNKLMETWEQLKPIKARHPNFSIKVNTVVFSDNYKDLDEIGDFVETLSPDMHTFDFLRGNPLKPESVLPPMEELPSIMERIKSRYRRYDGYKNLAIHGRFLGRLTRALYQRYVDYFLEVVKEKRQVIKCKAGSMSLVLYARGEVAYCEMLPPVGNLRDHDYRIRSLMEGRAAKSSKAGIANGDCHCFHPCYQLYNILFTPPRLLEAVRKYF